MRPLAVVILVFLSMVAPLKAVRPASVSVDTGAAKTMEDHGQLKDEMADSNEGYQLCCLCEQKKGKYFGYKNECAKKGDGPASQCGDKCNNKVREGWMCWQKASRGDSCDAPPPKPRPIPSMAIHEAMVSFFINNRWCCESAISKPACIGELKLPAIPAQPKEPRLYVMDVSQGIMRVRWQYFTCVPPLTGALVRFRAVGARKWLFAHPTSGALIDVSPEKEPELIPYPQSDVNVRGLPLGIRFEACVAFRESSDFAAMAMSFRWFLPCLACLGSAAAASSLVVAFQGRADAAPEAYDELLAALQREGEGRKVEIFYPKRKGSFEDMETEVQELLAQHPGASLVYMGHGMGDGGAAAAQHYAATAGGELDGLVRMSRMAEAWYTQQTTPHKVKLVLGMSHSDLMTSIPSSVAAQDLPSECGASEAKTQVSKLILDFLLGSSLDESQEADIFEPFVEMFVKEEGSWWWTSFSDEQGSSRWAAKAQRRLVEPLPCSGAWRCQNEFHLLSDEGLIPPYYRPKHRPNLTRDSGVLQSLTVAQLRYVELSVLQVAAGLNGWAVIKEEKAGVLADRKMAIKDRDDGANPTSAIEIGTKMVSVEAAFKACGAETSPSLDQGDHCKGINQDREGQDAYQLALNVSSQRALSRFQKLGRPLVMAADKKPTPSAGPWWIWNYLSYTDKSSEVEVASWYAFYPLSGPAYGAGNHYCKLLSPARALEWIYIDGLRKAPKNVNVNKLGTGPFSKESDIGHIGMLAARLLKCTYCFQDFDLQTAEYTRALENFWCPLCRIRHLDPFNAIVEQSGILRHHMFMRPTVSFNLDLPELKAWRKEEQSIFARCIKVNSDITAQVWPTKLIVVINGVEVFRIDPPEEGHVRRDVPKDISAGLRPGMNSVTVTIEDEHPSSYAFAIVRTQPKTAEQIAEDTTACEEDDALARVRMLLKDTWGIKENGHADPDAFHGDASTADAVDASANEAAPKVEEVAEVPPVENGTATIEDDDEEVTCVLSNKLKLRCPLSFERVDIPVRGETCMVLAQKALPMPNRHLMVSTECP
eukprot:s569_g27.t2